MTRGTQHKLAAQAGIAPGFLSFLKAGERNASAPIADRLADLTGTDIRVWLKGGSPEARRAAVEAWFAAQSEGNGRDCNGASG